MRKHWLICPPSGEDRWNYWTILKEGIISRLNPDRLVEEYLADPLSQDEDAMLHRQSIIEDDNRKLLNRGLPHQL